MPVIFAHRGASAHHRENTVVAFAAAGDLGADAVELDVRPGRGGFLVVHHDARLPDGRAIAGLAAGDLPGSLCTLDEALLACGDLLVNVEVKSDEPGVGVALARPVVEVVQAWGGRAIISSFDEATIDECHRLVPGLPTAQLTWVPDRPIADLLGDVRGRGHGGWHPHHLFVDEASLAAARAVDLEVNTWTVDDPERMVELAALGVDGIVTNDVPVAVAALR
jgi:glycerophosphoryl diester phosphodiesterase